MLKFYFTEQIKENFPYKPTFEQEKTLDMLSEYYLEAQDKAILLLKGYAGTGKTSLMGAFVQTLYMMKQKVVLLAPTGGVSALRLYSARMRSI